MKSFYILFIFINLPLLFIQCSEEIIPEEIPGKYEKGVFVLNQGNFGSGTGTLTYYDGDAVIEQKAYQQNNGGMTLGNVAQSMIKVDNQYFVAVNNAGKFVIIEDENLRFVTRISEIDQPRFFAEWVDNFLYLSEWGLDGVSGKIHKINPFDGSVVNTTITGGGPEKMVVLDNNLYICKSGGFATDSVLLKYNLFTDQVEDSFVVGHNPVDIIVDKIGTLWVLCSGMFDFNNPGNSTSGKLVQLDNGVILNSWELENGVRNLAHDVVSDYLYYLAGNSIMRINMRNSSNPEAFYNGSFYALAVEPSSGNVYATDAKDFNSNGEVLIISPEGQLVDSFMAGIIPGYIYFAN